MNRNLSLLAKIIFLSFTLILLFYYLLGIWISLEYKNFRLEQFWIGLIMMLLIAINIKIFKQNNKTKKNE